MELKDAVVRLGYDCDDWQQDNDVETASESGRCSSSDSFAIYSSRSAVDAMSGGYDETAKDGSLDGTSLLYGVNWTVLLPIDEADTVQAGLGGSRKDPPSAESMPEDRHSANEMKYLKAEDATDLDDMESSIEEGHDMCAQLKKKKSTTSRALLMLDEELDNYLDDYNNAVKYLCPKYAPALKLAKRGFTDGEYDIGSKSGDLRPGTYRSEKRISDCYWVRLTKHGSIIDNDFISYAPAGARVTIRSSDGGFESNGCGIWLPVG